MENCTYRAGISCSYVVVHSSDHGNATLFTWWLTLAHDPENDPKTTAQFTILLIITIIAVVANIIILMVITSNKKLRKIPTHQYTAAQNINYLWFISVSSMMLEARKAYHWTFTKAMCKVMLYTFSVSTFIAIWLFVFISMDRHIHVVQAVRKSRLAKIYPKYPIMAILLLVIFSMLFYIPTAVFFNVLPVIRDECTESTQCFMGNSNQTIYICTSFWPSLVGSFIWNIIMLCISYIIPSILISYNYWNIYHNVKKVRKRIQKRRKGDSAKVSRREMEIHVTVMCGMLVVLFFILWTPIFIVIFLVQFAWVQNKQEELISADLFFWIFSLTLVNATVSPLLYAMMNKKFIAAWEDYRFPFMDRFKCCEEISNGDHEARADPNRENSRSERVHSGTRINKQKRKFTIKWGSSTRNLDGGNKNQVSVIITPPEAETEQCQK